MILDRYPFDIDYCRRHGDALRPCRECAAEAARAASQQAHEASVARQRMRITIAPWREDLLRPSGEGDL